MANESRNNLFDTIPEMQSPSAAPVDALPDHANVYVPPRVLPQTSDHRTIQIKPVLLADHVDPRRAPTELRLPVLPLEPPRKEPAPWLLASSVLVVAIGSIAAAAWLGGWLPGSRTPGSVDPALHSSPLQAEDIPSAPAEQPEPVPADTPALPVGAGPALSPPAEDEANATRAEPDSTPTAMPLAPGPAPRQNAARVRKKAPDPWLE